MQPVSFSLSPKLRKRQGSGHSLICMVGKHITFTWIWYVGGPKRNRNFVIKNCVFSFRCYKLNLLQSTIHLMQCTRLNMFSTFQSSSETLAKWCLLMPLSFFSSPLPRLQNIFLWGLFSFGGIKRSHTERDRVIMAGGVVGSCYFWLKIVSHSRLCALARCRGEATTPHFAIPHSKSVGRNSRTHQTNQQDRQLFCNGLPRSVHEFSRCFHPFGKSRVALSEVGLQVTIHHSWRGKTTHKLVFSPVQLPCKLFQALQLFPCRFP